MQKKISQTARTRETCRGILLRRTKVERAADVQSEAEISRHRGIQPIDLALVMGVGFGEALAANLLCPTPRLLWTWTSSGQAILPLAS